MQSTTLNDELVMGLVELALSQPPAERVAYLRSACASDSRLFAEVWKYVSAEERMNGFLLDPLYPAPAAEQPFEIGQLLDGRFRIVREVAEGGMGVVYEAIDEKLERPIAIKAAKSHHRKRLPPEVRHAREIGHPNVCKIFEIHTAATNRGDIDFITMEFLDGETLMQRLRRGPLAETEARTVARQLCAGLAAAHRNGIIHGDLKSNNVVLTAGPDGAIRAVITDFGLARRPETTTQTVQSGAQGGTPEYMAPELWKGSHASVATDLYALGVIFYEMISGRRPLEAIASRAETDTLPSRTPSDAAAIWEERLTRRPPPVNPKWDRILGRLLDPDPARRFRNADEVAAALAPRSRRWMLTAAAAVVVAAISGVVTYERATAPRETVRLAVLPFETDSGTKALADGLLLDTGERLSHVKPGRARLTLIPLGDALQNQVDGPAKARTVLGATYTLSGILHQQNGGLVVQAYVTDTRTQLRVADWKAPYAATDAREIPLALAGFVTINLKLPPLAVAATVSPAAYQDWAQGVSLARGVSAGIDRAIEFLQRAVAEDSESPLTHARLAEAELRKYESSGEVRWWNAANESLKVAEVRNPDVATVRLVSGQINDALGKYEAAQADLQRALVLEPANGDLWRQLGDIYKHSNRLNDALAAYQRALDLQPDYFKNYLAMGNFYYDRFDFEQAVRQYQKLVQMTPDLPSGHFDLARPYLDMGRYSDAERELRRAIEIRETSSTVHALAVSLMYQGRNREAIAYYHRALELGPPMNKRLVLYLNMGTAYRRAHETHEAEQAYRESMDLAYAELGKNPRDGDLHASLAYLCARLHDRPQAESNVLQALELSPGDVNVLWMAAQTYEALGEHERTLALIQDAPDWLLIKLKRSQDLADLQNDHRFLELLATHQIQ